MYFIHIILCRWLKTRAVVMSSWLVVWIDLSEELKLDTNLVVPNCFRTQFQNFTFLLLFYLSQGFIKSAIFVLRFLSLREWGGMSSLISIKLKNCENLKKFIFPLTSSTTILPILGPQQNLI